MGGLDRRRRRRKHRRYGRRRAGGGRRAPRGRAALAQPRRGRRDRDRLPSGPGARRRARATRSWSWPATGRWIRWICPRCVEPIARGQADYVKGDRFARADTARTMPPARRLGGMALLVGDGARHRRAHLRQPVRVHRHRARRLRAARPRRAVASLRLSQRPLVAARPSRTPHRRGACSSGLRRRSEPAQGAPRPRHRGPRRPGSRRAPACDAGSPPLKGRRDPSACRSSARSRMAGTCASA